MNKEQIAGKYEQIKGDLKKTWGKLTDDDVALYNGQQDKFFGKVKELHGIAKEDAEKKITELQKQYDLKDPKAA